jgi:hypothetical protein
VAVAVLDGLELLQARVRIGERVQRQRRLVLRETMAVGKPRLLFLQVGAVRKQNLAELEGAVGQ